MTVSHAVEDAILGGERRSDGLWVHRGRLSVGPAGSPPLGGAPYSSGDINANRGDGTGVYYFAGKGDKYLYWSGSGFQLVGGPLQFTPAANTVNTLLGNYRQAGGWSVPAVNQWYESNAQVSVTTTGRTIRADASGALFSATAGAYIYVGLMTDGAMTFDSVTATTIPAANGVVPFGFSCYWTPLGGLHRFSIALYSNVATSSGFWNGVYTHLWITEQKG